ncbi:uncharacterized protein LOC135105178 [Scylla paramamosain]|uniref:uncharacterized protein LOC135105178 n=1 Tax=Scylla paramamosain TaxID=85552 RepID=UPI003082CDB5
MDTIVAGLGYQQGLEEDESPLDLTGPQATSTVAPKVTRDQLNRHYLQTLQEASEGSSEEFRSLRSTVKGSACFSTEGTRGSSGLGMMMALPLIDTEAMSGLSSSNFLVDHTQLSAKATQDQGQEQLCGENQSQDTSELHSDVLREEEKPPGLEQGEVRELLPYDTKENVNETEGELAAGLPSFLLKPQELVEDQDQQCLEGGDAGDLIALTSHLATADLGHEEFSTSQVQFDASQISARSTIHEGSRKALEVSKLLSNSCNSLGSMDGPSDPFLTHQQIAGAQDEDWLEAHQDELAHLMDDEEFRSPDSMFLEEDEKNYLEHNKFCMDMGPASSRNSLDASCFSGIHGVTEITVRPSWIGSPERELLRPGNHMLVDDYLQAHSEALGTLGANKDPANRPNFGNEVHSPPTATRIQPLEDASVGDESTTLDGSESCMKTDSSASSTLSKDSRENTLVSEGRQVSTTVTLERHQSREQTHMKEVIHEVEELEASIHGVKQPLEASTINSLLYRALATNAPHDLVGRILQLTQEAPVSSSSLEMTGLDASLEVMELRQMREDIARQKQRESKASHPLGKENRGREEGSKPASIPDRKPLQSVTQPEQCPPLALSHKHTKLMAFRTNSDPETLSRTCQEKNESNLEETLEGAQYMSKLVDDTAKLMMPSFSQVGTSIKSSTPCIPRSHIPVTDSACREPLPSASSNHRALPRMGVRSSTKMTELGVSVSRAESEVDLRTTSWPTNVSAHPTTITTNAYARPHHHKDAPHSYTNHIGVSVPQHVIFPEACVVGMATYTTLPLHNPSSRWLQISLSLMKETLDGSACMASVLLFQASYMLEPQGRCDVRLGVCCPVQGQLEALLKVQVGELTASGTRGTTPSTHTVVVTATITVPEVEVQCGGGLDCVDFGVVGESCCLSHNVTLISHCLQPLPLLLQLHQVAGSAPIFYWEENKNKTGKVVSPSHLSCELAPSTPTTFSLTLRAPQLDGVAVPKSGKIQVGSILSVLLDTPAPTPLALVSYPIKAAIGVVELQILRTPEPLVVDTHPHESGTTHFTLKNASCFPLHISLSVKEDSQAFSVQPSSFIMPPGGRSFPALLFIPGACVGTVNSELVIRVEPDGMEFNIAVSGVCHAPSLPLSSVLVSGSTSSHSTGARTTAPSLKAVTAVAPVSACVPAMPAPPTHKQLLNIHSSLAKSSSAPLSEVTSSPPLDAKNISSALQSKQSRLVFGTVAVGATSCLKLVLRNNFTSQNLPLSVTIIGSQAFKVCEAGSEDGQEKMSVVLKPCEEMALSVLLQPSAVESLSATLIFRHRSSSHPFKWKIPLQGYGGRGELVVKGRCAGKPFILKDLSLGLPAILQTSITNTGHRTLLLVLQMFSDKQCKEAATDLSVQPTRVVVGAGETHEVYIVASSTPRQLAQTPGFIGMLQVVSGEKTLWQRYQRMKNKEVKARHINNPDLLKINWLEKFSEQKGQQEPDILPPQPEDAVVFFNACTITQVELWGEQRPNEDHSVTVFANLAGEQTIADLTTTQIERMGSCDSTETQSIPSQPQSSSSTTWDVLPQTMSVQCGDSSPQVFFVVNFTSTQQMLEVSSSCSWLQIEPQEAVLLGYSTVRLCVTACPPHTLTSPVTYSLKVMGENESRSATITVLPATREATAAPITAKQGPRNSHQSTANILQPGTSTYQSATTTTTTTTTSQSSASGKFSQPPLHQLSSAASAPQHYTQCITSANTQPPVPSMRSQSHREPQKIAVQLESDDVSFPDTKTTKESYVKVTLKNLDKVDHSVQAEVTQGPFMVRHTRFTIKSGHYACVPVYFRPKSAGLCTGYLQLTVLKNKLVLPVSLTGRALP